MTAKASKKPATPKTKAPAKAAAKAAPTAASKAPSKGATIIALLRGDEGATLDQMIAATGWQKHSVRGFMAGALKKQHRLTVTSNKTDKGRVYRVAAQVQQ